MNISQKFKDYLQWIHQILKEKYKLTNINEITNKEILDWLRCIIDAEHLNRQYVSIWWENSWLSEILNSDQVTAIDNEYIRTHNGIYYWDGIVEVINNEAEVYAKSIEKEEEIPIGTICKVVWIRKIVQLGLASHKILVWKYFRVCDQSENIEISLTYKSMRYNNIIVEDINGNRFSMPQYILKPTKEKDFDSVVWKVFYNDILQEIIDKKKNDIQSLTSIYSEKLRQFMDASKLLHDACVLDVEEEAKKQVEYKINFIKDIKQNKQVSSIRIVTDDFIEFDTEPIFSDCWNLPIGKYKAFINLKTWEVRIKNLDINSDREYQHPHISDNGTCCLWDFVNPLRKAFDERDYVTLIAWLISFLESLYEDSVYITMEDFQSKRRKKFEY